MPLLSKSNRTAFEIYSLVIQKLLKDYADHKIFIFARDGIPLFDAFNAAVKKHDSKKIPPVRLINISIKSAEGSSDAVISKYLAANDLSLETVTSGEKILFIEPQGRGTIYRRVIKALLSKISLSEAGSSEKVKKFS